ncbi:15899_t:CDS:1, partial [Gigaspora rosea]
IPVFNLKSKSYSDAEYKKKIKLVPEKKNSRKRMEVYTYSISTP